MKYKYSSTMKWTNGAQTEHKINMDLELELTDILASANLETQLRLRQEEIRLEIAGLVSEKILPHILEDTGIEFITPGYLSVDGKTDNDTKCQIGIPTLPHTTLMYRAKMQIVMNLRTNRPVNAMQALHGNHGGFAVHIANKVMTSLKTAVLGISEDQTETDHSMKGNSFTKLDHRIIRSNTDQN